MSLLRPGVIKQHNPNPPPDFSMARNSMAVDLLFPVGFPKSVNPDFSDNFTGWSTVTRCFLLYFFLILSIALSSC